MSMDQIGYILSYEKEKQERQAIVNKLDLAEVINISYVGSQHGNENINYYRNWRRKLNEVLNPELKKIPKRTLWDMFSGSKKI
jgi:hypothetical protein